MTVNNQLNASLQAIQAALSQSQQLQQAQLGLQLLEAATSSDAAGQPAPSNSNSTGISIFV
ncbi:hypothetical protein [Neiella marina]|uniref:hypothetical protein n=1 Tax=Neiella marina TaxID=508461 RepID=UPI000B3C11DE|nr:hypothetical protein [Neiella marina]